MSNFNNKLGIKNLVSKVKKPNAKKEINKLVNIKLEELKNQDLSTDGRAAIMEDIKSLIDMEKSYKEATKKDSSLDVNEVIKFAGVVGSSLSGILGLAMILGYEKEDVVTSKALGIATKMLGK